MSVHVTTPDARTGSDDPVHTLDVVPSDPVRVTAYHTVSPDVIVVGNHVSTAPAGFNATTGIGVTTGTNEAPANECGGPPTDPEYRDSVALILGICTSRDAVSETRTTRHPSR